MKEIPSPIDLQSLADARSWAGEVITKKPYRINFFSRMSEEIAKRFESPKIIELGSGPGFLAHHLTNKCHCSKYTALDFSTAMHAIAKEKHPELIGNIDFVEGNFKSDDWHESYKNYDVVVSMQAIHEVRHRDLAQKLFSQLKQTLKPGGMFLYCDHFYGDGGVDIPELYLTNPEKEVALNKTGFNAIYKLYQEGTLSLWQAFN